MFYKKISPRKSSQDSNFAVLPFWCPKINERYSYRKPHSFFPKMKLYCIYSMTQSICAKTYFNTSYYGFLYEFTTRSGSESGTGVD